MITNILSVLSLSVAQPSDTPPCELKGIPAIDLVALRVAMLDQVMNGTERPASAQNTLDAIEAKAAACNPGDDAAADTEAAALATARLAADTVAEKLSSQGVEMAAIDVELKKTDRPVLEAFVAKRFDAVGVDKLGDRMTAAAGSDASEQVRKLLGAYAFNAARLLLAAPVVSKPAKPVER